MQVIAHKLCSLTEQRQRAWLSGAIKQLGEVLHGALRVAAHTHRVVDTEVLSTALGCLVGGVIPAQGHHTVPFAQLGPEKSGALVLVVVVLDVVALAVALDVVLLDVLLDSPRVLSQCSTKCSA